MYLQKLTIFNFRSYYGKKEFVFSEHLNLILGSNGDGKSTFFDALNWVLTPDYAVKEGEEKLPEDSSLVSAKMFKELLIGQSGRVLVSIELKNNSGQTRIIERSFNVLKKPDGSMKTEARAHKAFQQVGIKRKEFFSVKDVLEKENVFPAVIKKYHLFKGEDKLNIFDDKATLQALIDMFSDIRDFEAYKDFASYAQETLQGEVEKIKKKEGAFMAKIARSQDEIKTISKQIEQEEVELAKANKEHKAVEEQITDIGSDRAIIKKTAPKRDEVQRLKFEIDNLSGKIDERFGLKLLDDQWILMGFAPVLQEFNSKLESLKQSKDNIENDYRREQEEELGKTKIDQARTELEKIVWRQSDVDRMKSMMHTHRCIYCGSDASEGSVAYDFIRQRLNDVINLLTPKSQETRIETKRFFSGRNIETLKEIGASLTYTGKDIDGIKDEIDSLESVNAERRKEIGIRQKHLEELLDEIEMLNASSKSGKNLNDFDDKEVDRWYEKKEALAIKIGKIKDKIKSLGDLLTNARKDQGKVAKGSAAAPLLMADNFFRLFGNAIENIEADTYDNLLNQLVKDANMYLSRLNVDDFTGTIKIERDIHDELKPELQDKSGQELSNPNTSLLTTMHISLLLAIAEMTRQNRDADYPLIFDAPTSSFDEGKDKSFYECLNTQVERQCIVVTKSYLYKNDSGEFVTDKKALDRLNCKKYRIKKKTGFDKLDITTIDTEVEEIKED